jgi:hypothetical protein
VVDIGNEGRSVLTFQEIDMELVPGRNSALWATALPQGMLFATPLEVEMP